MMCTGLKEQHCILIAVEHIQYVNKKYVCTDNF